MGWILVGILTAINVVVFLKLKQASEQMLKMAFPSAKNMGDAMAQMQKMMGGMGGGMPGMGRGGRGGPQAGSQDARLKAAMEMLQKTRK